MEIKGDSNVELLEHFKQHWEKAGRTGNQAGGGMDNIVIYEALCFDVAQGRMNGAPNETRTHSCRFSSQAC